MYDCIVIGAGVVGSAAAYHLSRKDKNVLLLEQMQIKKHGGHIQEEEKVERIIPGRTVTVKTNKGEYTAKGLIITPGPWGSQLLKPLGFDPPIRVKRATVCYWKDRISGSSKNYPVFSDHAFNYPSDFTSPCYVYGFPSDEYPGLRKIGVHQGTETVPDDRDGSPSDKRVMDFLLSYMETHFPELAGEKPSIVESCMYSVYSHSTGL